MESCVVSFKGVIGWFLVIVGNVVLSGFVLLGSCDVCWFDCCMIYFGLVEVYVE